MKLKHIISAAQFDTKTLEEILSLASSVKAGKYNKKALAGKILAALFYEPSTRTRLSFESAMLRLGGQVISTENAGEFSSAIKGESLEDSVRIVSFFSDVIVIRHGQAGASETASGYSTVPLINGGDGNGEHPTQALYDMYTIFSKFKTFNLKVAMMGDLLNGRTIHSLSYLLSLYSKAELVFISPKALAIPEKLRNDLKAKKINFSEMEDMKEGINDADVIYQTRIQKERFKTSDYMKYFGKYIIDLDTTKLLKKNSIIMHPLPRVNEIAPEVDNTPFAYYFQQAQNGLYVRMAVLLYLLAK